MVRSLFGNSNRKLRSTFWGSPFIPVGTNQTECCLPLTNFSVPSRFQTHATQIRPFLDSNRNGCGISTVNWQIAYHYAFAIPTGFFCQMVSTHGVGRHLKETVLWGNITWSKVGKQGWQYGKGLIYMGPLFRLTKQALLRPELRRNMGPASLAFSFVLIPTSSDVWL